MNVFHCYRCAHSPQELSLRGNRAELCKSRLRDAVSNPFENLLHYSSHKHSFVQDIEVLSKALSSSAQVLHLDLSYNAITDEGVTYLAEQLKVRYTNTGEGLETLYTDLD